MEAEIENYVKELTLDEKIGMIHGDGLFRTRPVPRLGIPALKMSDGPMGVRNEFDNEEWMPVGNHDDYVTYLPCNSALAAAWNRKLAYEVGKALGEEARGRGKDVILAPGINIKRSPLCGRNFEYMSEDPFLAGEMAVPLIQGIQTADVAACVKHFALNNQETERLWAETIVSDRALWEIYLPAFKKAVEQGNSLSIMGAYNRFRGEHCCESKLLLNEILRKQWNYDGVVISDWGAVHKTKEAAESGLDIEMSVTNNFDEYCMAEPLKKAVEKGELPETLLDEKVRNILRLMFRLHMLEEKDIGQKETEQFKDGDVCEGFVSRTRKAGSYNTPEHRNSALEAARESVVLLKNEGGILPLSPEKTKKVLVIGDNADRIHSNGGGSAEIKALYEITPLMGIKKLLGGNAEVTWVPGYTADDMEALEAQGEGMNWQADSLENGGGSSEERQTGNEMLLEKQAQLRAEALQLAAEYDTVIFIGGQNHLQDLEGHDRPDMKLPYAQDVLLRELLAVNPHTIVVMVSGSPVEMPWIHQANALVWHWYAGMEGGTALAEVLFGRVNPSGRLPETFPVSHMDCPAHCIGEFAETGTVDYKEGIFVGYRYYDRNRTEVLFPFGYGLSYTEFSFENIKVEKQGQGEDVQVQVSAEVTNTGTRKGKEVVQLYVGMKDSSVERAKKELKAFEKVELEAGERKTVCFELDEDAFAFYREEEGAFCVEPGEYVISVGKSVEDICLEGIVWM